MIDVVFLLLVFFMLAARFGPDMTLPLATAGGDAVYEGPPRLVRLDGQTISLNGISMPIDEITRSLEALMSSPDNVILVQPSGDATLQGLIDTLDALRTAGFETIAVVPER
jgi:biopolymer transport protein ExbD